MNRHSKGIHDFQIPTGYEMVVLSVAGGLPPAENFMRELTLKGHSTEDMDALAQHLDPANGYGAYCCVEKIQKISGKPILHVLYKSAKDASEALSTFTSDENQNRKPFSFRVVPDFGCTS